MRSFYALRVLLAAMLWLPCVTAAEPLAARGKALADACAACHGPDGRSQGAVPSIDTMPADTFITVLQAFRADARQGTVMNRIAKGLDDADIEAMAVYFTSRRSR